MQSKNRVRKKYFLLLAAFLLVTPVTGCGKTDASGGNDGGSSVIFPDADAGEGYSAYEETEEGNAGGQQDDTGQKTSGGQTVDPLPEMTEEEKAALQYVEKVVLQNYFGDKVECEVYVPKDGMKGADFVSFIDHGLHFSVTVVNLGFDDLLDEYLNDLVQADIDDWGYENSGYSEMEFGEMIRCGDDRFRIASAMNEDFYGTPYAVKKIYFMDVIKEGVGVSWTLEVFEIDADDKTNAVIDEIAKCYRVDLEAIKTGGTWAAGDAKRRERLQDEYEPLEGELVLEKVEGYQYMGLTMISDYKGEVQCPIMIPMGWQTSVMEDEASAHMHGVRVSGHLDSLYGKGYLSKVQSSIDNSAATYERLSDTYANVRIGSTQPISGYDMARYAVITYEQKDYLTEEFFPRVDVLCYIKVQEDYVLHYTVTLLFEEYDDSTNILLKELETAYGIDLSEYYYEKV